MPGKVRVKILAGRNLPIMDRGSETTDAYVEIKLANITYKTDVYRKSLNPQWNSDFYRFELDDAELQDEPLQIRLMDHDTYSANDAIGKVNISLNPLLLPNFDTSGQVIQSGKGSVMSGWIPVFDTMHGIRGEVNLIVKVDLFSDVNKFRQSSCGVQFFHSTNIPHGYHAQFIHGFVEELVVNDDPEYQWIDKIRTPRASNEARQTVFLRLSGQVQRKIGLKAIDLGANAVIGYKQCFDLEGDVGVVARGIGTAVTLVKILSTVPQQVMENVLVEEQLKYLEFLVPDEKTDETNRPANNSDNIISKLFGLPASEYGKLSTTTTLKPILLNKKLKKYDSTQTIVEESTEDIDKLRVQLEQEDCRGEGGSRLRRGMRKISTSSKNLLEKRKHVFGGGKKSKRNHKPIDSTEEDSSSLMGSAQEIYRVSPSNSLRNSLTDIRGKLKILTPKPKYQRAKSDGVAMTALLVRSMMVAPTALDCIDEANDSPKSSVKSQSIEPIKSGSMSNLSGSAERNIYLKPAMAYTAAHLKISDSNLSSNFSESSCTISSVSTGNGDEEDCSESEETTQNDILLVDADTVSMVVKSVLAQEQSERNKDDWIEPSNVLEQQRTIRCVDEIRMSKPSSNKRDSFDCGDIDSDMLKALMISPNDDEDAANWIQPGSTADEPECLPEKRRGSVFHELKENISEKIHHLQEHIHFPHRHHDEVKNRHGLLATALDTILIEQANILGAPLPSVQPEMKHHEQLQQESKEKSDTLMSKRRSSIDAIRKKITHSFQKRLSISEKSTKTAATIATQTDDPMEMDRKNSATSPTKEYVLSAPFLSLNDLEQIDANEMNKMSYGSAMEFGSIKEAAQPFISLTDLYTVHDSNSSNSCVSMIQPLPQIPSQPPPPQPPTLSNPSLNPLVVFENLTNNPPPTVCESNNFSCEKSSIKNELINCTTTSVTITTTNKFDETFVDDHDARCDLLSCNTNKAFLLTPFPNPIHHRSETVSTTIASPNTKVIATATSGHIRAESTGGKMSQSPAKNTLLTTSQTTPTSSKEPVCRRSSDSDLNVTPKGCSLSTIDRQPPSSIVRVTATTALKIPLNQDNLDMLEYPFLTMSKYPDGFILHLGATVCARSVKLLERVPNPDEPETRDSWWTELRMEIRSHARSLGCNVILGYSEITTISDDVCVLSATGTAAVINLQFKTGEIGLLNATVPGKTQAIIQTSKELGSQERQDSSEVFLKATKVTTVKDNGAISTATRSDSNDGDVENVEPIDVELSSCTMCHVPYSTSSLPFNVHMKKCAICKHGKVPDVLLSTIEIPENIQIIGRGCFLQAQVCRTKRDLKAESNAKEISDGLPFLEYDLHKLLINKLRTKGMNAIFGLKATVAIGEKMMALISTGTAVFLSALPAPTVPKIVPGNSWTNAEKLAELQRSLQETFDRNREIYQLKSHEELELNQKTQQSDTDDSDEEVNNEIDFTVGHKDTCVLEVDDVEDLEIISLLMEQCPPDGFHVVNTQTVPGLHDLEVVRNLQMFTQIWRAKLSLNQQGTNFPRHFQRLLQTIYFKLRTMIPCAICDLKFRLDLPDSEEIQLLVTGMALGLGEPTKLAKFKRKTSQTSKDGKKFGSNGVDDEMIFSLEEEQFTDMTQTQSLTFPTNHNFMQTNSLKLKSKSPTRTRLNSVRIAKHLPLRERYGVDVTYLSYVPGGNIDKYLGNLNFFFIRECTSIRENGGISGFVHSFITELLAVVRAHVTALGGNAMISFYMTELILVDNPHKNQGQCLISVGGDVVFVSYYSDD